MSADHISTESRYLQTVCTQVDVLRDGIRDIPRGVAATAASLGPGRHGGKGDLSDLHVPGLGRGDGGPHLDTNVDIGASKSSIRRFVITEKAPTRAFSPPRIY